MEFDNLIKNIYDKDDSKFEKWYEHRKIIRDVIDKRVAEVNLDNNKSIAIWGAGKCYDIDLTYLSNKFNRVMLLDINEDCMKDALKLHNVTGKKNIEIKKVDFMGNTDKIYREFFELVENRHSVKELRIYLENLKESITRNNNINSDLDKFNITLCLGVHSQILVAINIILMYAQNFYDKKDIEDLINIFKICKKEAEKNFNQSIINHSTDLLFIGFDLMELSLKNGTEKFYGEIEAALLKNDIEGVIRIAMQCPVSGAAQAAEDMWNRIINKKLKFDGIDCWLWDYDITKSYVFILETLIKK
ncbi:hypothetical protein [Clostridium pasteurianum]|uniref:Methyltransferase domain-containing protein n=1 Tax=Clostridium pasteurianum BC1 TaxID=86416 RepID=R4K7Q8_CLOPA|nr:hypothetical protein [Clostridium pasteurianum]AGK96529.1 hypothetical protein Clopa_1603 [Clostridium pasteurianum BC1]